MVGSLDFNFLVEIKGFSTRATKTEHGKSAMNLVGNIWQEPIFC